MKTILNILFFVTILTGCCNPSIDKEYFEFSNSEEEFLDPFKSVDTIYFVNDEFDTDTILIKKIIKESHNECSYFIQRAPVNWVAVEVEHLPLDKWTGTSQNQGEEIRITYQHLFSMGKDFEQNSVGISISFRGFYCNNFNIGLDNAKTYDIYERTFQNCYKLEHNNLNSVTNLEEIVHVYWTKEDGMVAYENKSGKIWIKRILT